MKTEIIVKLNKSFEESVHSHNGVEYWMARDIQQLLDYTQWRNFLQVIDKAKIACLKSNQNVADHFADVSKMVDLGKGVQRRPPPVSLRGTRRVTKQSFFYQPFR